MLVVHVINGAIYLCDQMRDAKMHQVSLEEAIEVMRQASDSSTPRKFEKVIFTL
jgi:hypothetical protein